MTSKGFTLLETLVVVAIVGILAMIAVPSYRAFVERAEAASDSTESSGTRIAQALTDIEGPLPSASAAPSTPAATETPAATTTTGTPAAAPASETSEPAGTPTTAAAPADPPSTPAPGVSTASPSSDPADEATASTPETPTGGGSAAPPPATAATVPAIAPPADYAECTSDSGSCKVKAGKDFELTFNVASLGKLSDKDIKVVTTGGADVNDFDYSSKKGTVTVELEAPDKKDKLFSLTLNADKEKITLYFKTS